MAVQIEVSHLVERSIPARILIGVAGTIHATVVACTFGMMVALTTQMRISIQVNLVTQVAAGSGASR